MISRLSSVASAVAWLAIAVVISLGVAGIAASMGHTPGTPARAELTWEGDQETTAALDGATNDLQTLSDRVDDLGSTARDALSQVAAGDTNGLQASITKGTLLLDAIDAANANLRSSIDAVPHSGDDWALQVSSGVHDRYQQLSRATTLASGLEADWASLTGRSLDAATMNQLLALHDTQTADAAQKGTAGQYKDALTALDGSDATIAHARTLRDELAKTSDVATLTSWIDRNAAYDAALRNLYGTLIASNGRVTDPVRKAFDQERAARALLPPDTRPLVVIMSDIAQGGLNQAVISIEETRGALDDALNAQQQLQGGATQPPDAALPGSSPIAPESVAPNPSGPEVTPP